MFWVLRFLKTLKIEFFYVIEYYKLEKVVIFYSTQNVKKSQILRKNLQNFVFYVEDVVFSLFWPRNVIFW